MSVRVSALVVNFEQRELLRACLSSLREALRPFRNESEIIVVDNGSSDGSAEMVRGDFPGAVLIELNQNKGFAGGVDVGVRQTVGEWIFCMNNDAIVAPDAIIELMRVAESGGQDLGSVAALMVFADRPNVINSAGIEIDRLGVASDRLLGEPVDVSEREPVEVFGPSAGAALYRRTMLEEVPFDGTFFAYYEDVDVAWRARMQGWRCLYAPSAVVEHHHSATALHGSPFKYYWSGRNRIRVLAKNATARQLGRHGLAIFAYDCAYIAAVLAVDRTATPLQGRVDGLRSWRRDRRAAAPHRRAVDLVPFLGFRAAFRRLRAGPRVSRPRVVSDDGSR